MPVCENCQTPYDEWQHFCLNCGHHLKPAPLAIKPCPQCGAQVALTHKYCYACGSPLTAVLPPTARVTMQPWLWGGVALVLFSLGVLLGFSLPRLFPGAALAPVASSGPPVAQTSRPPIATPGSGADTSAALMTEVLQLLERIKEANLQKDIALYLDTLSALYPQIDQKRRNILATWNKFAFQDMAYTVLAMRRGENGKVVAEVKWRTTTQDLATQEPRQDEFLYRLWLVQELGQWKISQIEELQP